MVRQKLLDRVLDECLHPHTAQHGGELELALFRLADAGAELDLGFRLVVGNGACAAAPGIVTLLRHKFDGRLDNIGQREILVAARERPLAGRRPA
jgi:hypothetical protein